MRRPGKFALIPTICPLTSESIRKEQFLQTFAMGNNQKSMLQLTTSDSEKVDKAEFDDWKEQKKRSSESLASAQSFGSSITVFSAAGTLKSATRCEMRVNNQG